MSTIGRTLGGFSGWQLARLPGRLFGYLLAWQERAEQRRTLQQLDDHMLRDLGLSRADVAREADKSVWRP